LLLYLHIRIPLSSLPLFFLFNAPATPRISTLSLHDALPICQWLLPSEPLYWFWAVAITSTWLVYWISTLHFGLRFSNLSWRGLIDRKSTRLNSSHVKISYAVFCLKKKKKKQNESTEHCLIPI